MSEIIKVCKKHGKLDISQLIKSGIDGVNKDIQRYRCKLCQSYLHRKNYLKNKDNLSKKHKEYRSKNIEKIKEIRKNYREKQKIMRDIKLSTPRLPTPLKYRYSKKFILARSRLIHLLWNIDKVIYKCG